MEIKDVQHLAQLSRIALTDDEAAALAGEFDVILAYVAHVTEVSANAATEPARDLNRNVLREDVETCKPGAYTEVLLSAAPERAGAYVQVKKILTGKG